MKRFFFILIFLNLSLISFGTTYHVDTTGAGDYQTLAQVNAATFLAGDSVLFKRGQTFYGGLTTSESGSTGNPIYFGAYGTGADPIISGDIPLTGWQQYSGNIYRVYCTSDIYGVYNADTQLYLARYPNTGWLDITVADLTYPYNTFEVGALSFNDDSLNNSTARIRTTNWTYEYKIVSDQTGDEIILGSNSAYQLKVDYGLYFDGLAWMLDTVNEWYYTATNDSLYVYFENVSDTSNISVLSVADGVNTSWNTSYHKYENIHFTNFSDRGIEFEGTSHEMEVDSCTFEKIITHAVYWDSYAGNDGSIKNSTFRNVNGTAIRFSVNRGTIYNNSFYDIGMLPGYGISGDDAAMGIFFRYQTCDSIDVYDNYFNNIGYNGGRFTGHNHNIYNNVLDSTLMTLNDGGAIYTYYSTTAPSTNLYIHDNIVNYVYGNMESSGSTSHLAVGIYFDGINDKFYGSRIYNNTIVESHIGIFIQYTCRDIDIQNNILFNCDYGLRLLTGNDTITFKYNQIVSLADQYNLNIYASTLTNAIFDSNYYINPYTKTFIIDDQATAHYIGLDRWTTEYTLDSHSFYSPYRWKEYEISSYVDETNRLSNGTFDAGSTGWSSGGGNFGWNASSPLDDGAIYFEATSSTQNTRVNSPVISDSLYETRYYELAFDVIGDYPGSIWFRTEEQVAWIPAYGIQEYIAYEDERDSVSIVVAPTDTGRSHFAFITYERDSLFWLDNVSFKEVNAQYYDPADRLVIYTNTTSSSSEQDMSDYLYYDMDNNVVSSDTTIPAYGSATFYILDSCEIALSASITDAPAGSIDLTVSGGESPYTYLWSNEETTQDISGLDTGSYSVKVTDNTGCYVTDTYSVGYRVAKDAYISNGLFFISNGIILIQ